MGQYIINRILIAIPVLIGVTLLSYALMELAPGDPVTAFIDPITRAQLGEEWVEMRREQLGLNEPLATRYGIWLRELAQGNLGFSLINGQPVSEHILTRLGPTSLLMGTALLIGTVVGIPLGILSAVRQYSVLDYITTIGGFMTISTPSFFLALSLVYLFAVRWRVFPSSGMRTLGQDDSVTDLARHMILPVTVLALAQVPLVMRYARSTMLEVLRQDYMTTARAKGLGESTVLMAHAFRNALIPLITVVGLSLPELIVPVPLHWTRRWRRGFNQAEMLGWDLAQAMNIPLMTRLCRRTQRTPSQRGLSRTQRQQNLRNAFSLSRHAQTALEGKCVALLDDVVTTTSTVRALSTQLIEAGAAEVHVWAVARTPEQRT